MTDRNELEAIAARVADLATAWGDMDEAEKRDAIVRDLRALARRGHAVPEGWQFRSGDKWVGVTTPEGATKKLFKSMGNSSFYWVFDLCAALAATPAPEAEGCGACGDGCNGGACRLASESPEADDAASALAWMRAQAKALGLQGADGESPLGLSRFLAGFVAAPEAGQGVEALAQRLRSYAEADDLLPQERRDLLAAASRLATPPVAADGVEALFDVIRKAVEESSPRWGEAHDNPMLHKIDRREREWIASRVFAEVARRLASAQQDDDSADGTPDAHPAYWRGESRGVEGACMRIADVLDGKDSGDGALGHPSLEGLRRRLLSVRQPSAPAAVPEGFFSLDDLTDGEGAKRIRQGVEEWMRREMPEGTVIGDPHWWATRIIRAFAQVLRAPVAGEGVGDG